MCFEAEVEQAWAQDPELAAAAPWSSVGDVQRAGGRLRPVRVGAEGARRLVTVGAEDLCHAERTRNGFSGFPGSVDYPTIHRRPMR